MGIAAWGMALTLALAALPVAAQEAPGANALPDSNVFFLGGRFIDGDMAEAALPFAGDVEDNTILGGGVQSFVYDSRLVPAARLGFEAGLALRLGSQGRSEDSAEFWAGAVARYDGLVLFDTLKIAPAFTFGLSAVTGTLPGREARLEALTPDNDASLLFYLGPEIAVSLKDHETTEVFYRLHHRSGAWGALGDMEGASNANVVGLRFQF